MGQDLFGRYNPYSHRLVRNTAFVPLLREEQRRQHVSTKALAQAVGLSRTHIYKLFEGTRSMTEEQLQSFFIVLGIDRSRAFLAVMELGDWQRYHDPNVVFVADLVQAMLPALEERRRSPTGGQLSAKTVQHLSFQLADALAQNDAEVAERRELILARGRP